MHFSIPLDILDSPDCGGAGDLATKGENWTLAENRCKWDINPNFRAEIGGGGERAQEPHQDADLALPKAELRSPWDITCWIKSTGWSPERIAASQVRECYFGFTDTQIQCLSHSLVSRSLRRNQIKYRSFKRMRVAHHVPYLNEKQQITKKFARYDLFVKAALL